jgi:large conductance mechanosensitive channel
MNRINRMVKSRLSAAEPEEQPIPADTALLAEIRDLLAGLAGPESDGDRAGAPGTAGVHAAGTASAHLEEDVDEDSPRHAASR